MGLGDFYEIVPLHSSIEMEYFVLSQTLVQPSPSGYTWVHVGTLVYRYFFSIEDFNKSNFFFIPSAMGRATRQGVKILASGRG